MSMRLRFKELGDSDRGATALLVASTMVLIMGVAAVVIDGGFGFSERRQAQAAVDFGALAALQAAKSCGTGCSIPTAVNNGATEAMTVVAANLPGRTLDWSLGACDDTNRPAEFNRVSTLTDCVSFTDNLDKSRVYLPDDAVATTFGRVIGFNNVTVVAEAEAGAYIEASTDVIPHTPTGSAGGEACLFANQAPQSIPPCDGALSGFYGYLDVALYGKDHADGSVSTPSTCNNGTTTERIAINMAKGGDHNLVEYSFGPPADAVADDFNACPNTEEDINQVRVQTGSPTAGVTDGLINGVSGSINGQPFSAEDGRLVCGAYSTDCETIRSYNLDHTPLWDYLVPGTCTGPDPTTHDEMEDCLDNYPPGNPPQFTADIVNNPRYAAIPILYSNGANPNDPAPDSPGAYKIKEFIPVWIETLFFNCNANSCNTIHSPGLTTAPPACPNPIDPAIRNCGWGHTTGSNDVESMIAFTLTVDMLDPSVAATFPGTEETRSYALTK
ncbi:MAG: hypothetical protein ACRDVL_10730 [Acidimicrobiia bacterium]